MLLWVLSDFWPYWLMKKQVRNEAEKKHDSKVGESPVC